MAHSGSARRYPASRADPGSTRRVRDEGTTLSRGPSGRPLASPGARGAGHCGAGAGRRGLRHAPPRYRRPARLDPAQPRAHARRRAARGAHPQRRPEQALRGRRAAVRAADHRPAAARGGRRLLVRAQVPRPPHLQRRGLRHVRDDGRAPDDADPELRARAQPGQRAPGDRARQRPRPLRAGPRHRPELYRGAAPGRARGVAPVEVERLTFEQIRSGAWRRGGWLSAL